jgi:acetyltransferase-like isoleucine patch superfamily enzyme
MPHPVHSIEGNGIADSVVIHPMCLVDYPPSRSPSLARVPVTARETRIGHRTELMPFALVYRSAWIGADCLIGNHASIREGATIGDRCIIGRNVTINYEAVIEDEVRIQDGAHITGGCRIGRGSFIGVNVTTSNDRRREIVDYQWVGATPPVIGRRCLIGSGANIIPGVRIGDGAVIGAGALVTKDVPAGGTVLGDPSRIRNSPVTSLEPAYTYWQEQVG